MNVPSADSSGSGAPTFRVERVDPRLTRPLRHAVLRAGMPLDSTIFPGDADPQALHVAVRRVDEGAQDELVSVGMTYPDAPPWETAANGAWRIRGMATRDGLRGGGLGRMVLDTLIAHASERGGRMIWCNARVGAERFYLRAGFSSVGEVFDDGIALHQAMWRPLPERGEP